MNDPKFDYEAHKVRRKCGDLYAVRVSYTTWKVAEVVTEDGAWITWPCSYSSREAAEEAARLGDEYGYIASAMRKGVRKS